MQKEYKNSELRTHAINLLEERGISLEQIAELAYDLQLPYNKDLTLEIALHNVNKVLEKREVQYSVVTGIEIDKVCEAGGFSDILTKTLMRDEGLYGIDEVIALSIVNVYGSIGFTSFGYIDKLKPKALGEIDKKGKEPGVCNTFIDDIVGAIAAATASRIAHSYGKE